MIPSKKLSQKPSIDSLEARCLLSATGVLDTSFGDHGYLNGYRAQALLGGSIIASDASGGPEVLASPDGKNVQPYGGPVLQPPAQNVQSDGKYLVLAGGVLTRYNKNGTVDKTFGNNGVVSDFGNGIADDSFTPNGVLVEGTRIFIAGDLHYSSGGYGVPSLERLTPSGSVDSAFGDHGIAHADDFAADYISDFKFMKLGPDGEIYTDWDMDDAPELVRFTTTGRVDGGYFIDIDAPRNSSVYGLEFAADGKVLILHDSSEYLSLVRLNHDLTPDSSFGQSGIVQIQPQFGYSSLFFQQNPATLLVRPDGEIIVGTSAFDSQPPFTVAMSPGTPAGRGTVSGHFFNDLNGDKKQEASEPGLGYWQAYADLNNNGVLDAGEPSGFAGILGKYSINGLSPGTYIIREVRQDGWIRTTPAGAWPLGYYKVTVKANQTLTGLNFGNAPTNRARGSITGTLFNDIDGDRIQDNSEPGLAGWQAYVDLNNSGVFKKGDPIATADKNGHYVITGVAAGGYAVREIRKAGWARTSPPGDWPLGRNEAIVSPGKTSAGNNFGNALGSSALVTVSGVVYHDANNNGALDSGEKGLGGITVVLWNAANQAVGLAPWLTTTTAADGSYAFYDLAPGTYYLEPHDKDYVFDVNSDEFILLPSHTLQLDFFDPVSG